MTNATSNQSRVSAVWSSQPLRAAGIVAAIWITGTVLNTVLNPYDLRVIVNCGIAAILALGLNLINGCAGQFSLGHAGFMAVGAYTSAALTTVLPTATLLQNPLGVGAAIVAGGIVAASVGYLVGLPSLRLKGDYLAIVTLGFGEVIRIVFLNVPAVGGARGLSGIPSYTDFFWVYLWLTLAGVSLWRLVRSPQGRAILALRDNEIAAEAMGVATSRYKVLSFVVGSFFAGIGGGLFAHYQGFIDPQQFDFSRSVLFVIMVVIGGMGSFSGAIAGAFLVTMLPESLRVFDDYRLVVFPLLLILVMLVRPRGIFGHRELWQILGRK